MALTRQRFSNTVFLAFSLLAFCQSTMIGRYKVVTLKVDYATLLKELKDIQTAIKEKKVLLKDKAFDCNKFFHDNNVRIFTVIPSSNYIF